MIYLGVLIPNHNLNDLKYHVVDEKIENSIFW